TLRATPYGRPRRRTSRRFPRPVFFPSRARARFAAPLPARSLINGPRSLTPASHQRDPIMADARSTNPPTATPSNARQTAGPASKDGPNHEQISRRAYELFQKRGGKHGYHMEDWHEAERQLREERQDGRATASAAKTTA